eukprot:gene22947-9332_t
MSTNKFACGIEVFVQVSSLNGEPVSAVAYKVANFKKKKSKQQRFEEVTTKTKKSEPNEFKETRQMNIYA